MTGFAEFIQSVRPAPGAGSSLSQVLARAAAAGDRTDPEPDFDDQAAAMLTRGYSPGLVSQLSQRLGDTVAELQGEREKLEKGTRRQEHVMRAHEAGRLHALAIPDALGDLGDEALVRQLERRAEHLRAQIQQAAEAIAPPSQRDPDPLEAAATRAHEVFVEVTRARMAAAEARRPEPRPFARRSGVGAGAGEVTCEECVKAGASEEESFLIHSDADLRVAPEVPSEAELDWRAGRRHAYSGGQEIVR